MSETCETATVNRDGQQVIINKSDLQPSDVIWKDEPVNKPVNKPVKGSK